MSKDSWFKFFSDQYLLDRDVYRMPLESQAILVRLWCVQNSEGSIPNNPEEVADHIRVPVEAASAFFDTYIANFFELRGDRWVSRRLELEKDDNRKRNRAGQIGASARWSKQKDKCESHMRTVDANDECESHMRNPSSLISSGLKEELSVRERALAICQVAKLPATNSNLDVIQASIESLITETVTMDEASNKILTEVERKIQAGERLNRFWFENGGYNPKPEEKKPEKPKPLPLNVRMRMQDEEAKRVN